MKKLFYFIVALIMIAINLCGCTLISDKVLYEIKDTNGDDTSLAVLTDEDIFENAHLFHCTIYTGTTAGENSFPEDHPEKELTEFFYDRDQTLSEAQTHFSGVEVLQATYGKSDTITFTVTSKLTEGNLRIVLIDYKNRAILYDFEVGTTDSFTVTNSSEEEYEIRVAGESAIFDITTLRTFNSQE